MQPLFYHNQEKNGTGAEPGKGLTVGGPWHYNRSMAKTKRRTTNEMGGTESVRVDKERFERLAQVAYAAKGFSFRKKQLLDMAMEIAIDQFERDVIEKKARARIA